ncbi:MAG: hypothetical protein IIA67_09090 [Planctomycetes bacterium]|nr:hypothetical protein [Planctomycetota bacterium]
MRFTFRSGRICLNLTVLLMAWLAGAADTSRGQEPDENPRVARLIKRLGSPSFVQRRRAGAELARLGEAGRRQLEKAAESDDPEVRLRADRLLKKLKLREMWSASIVQVEADEQPASAVIRSVAGQSGNLLDVGEQFRIFNDKKITLDYRQGSFWQVIDDVCQRSGNYVRPHYDTRKPGLVVVAGKPGKFPKAYAGPLRVRLTTAQRLFKEEFDYEDESSDVTHIFRIGLSVLWEQRFRLVAYREQPSLVAARTDTGVPLTMNRSGDASWQVTTALSRQISAEMLLPPPPTSAKRLDVLTLRWELIAVGDMATLEVSDLSAGTVHRRDDLELSIESIEKESNTRHVLTVEISRNLVIPEPREVLFHENEFELLDAKGKPLRRVTQTGALTDTGARLKIVFESDSAGRTPKTLRLHYPRIRARRSLDITFRNVPLPLARPK